MMNLCELPQSVIQADLNLNRFSLEKVANGISKKVYIVTDDHGNRTILYIWQKPFLGLTGAHTEGLDYLYAEGFEYFCHNTRLLTDIGIRVPRIIKTGHFSANDNFAYAYVECFEGVSLQEYLQYGRIKDVSDKVGAELKKFYACGRDYYGPPIFSTGHTKSCQQLCYEHAVEELGIACGLDSDVEGIKNLVCRQLNNFMVIFSRQAGPAGYTLIHGEATPQHIWLLNDGTIGFIDIEGVKYFEIEFEYALLEMLYSYLPAGNPEDYDRNKVLFYRLYHRICWLSVAVDYLQHVDKNSQFFIKLRRIMLRELSGGSPARI